MSSLSVTEKQHWKSRIERKVKQRVKALLAREDPFLKERIWSEARAKAKEELGIAELLEEIKAMEKEEEELAKKIKKASRDAALIAQGKDPKDPEARLESAQSHYTPRTRIANLIEQRAALIVPELMEASELGRQVSRLEAEADAVIDAVWLATTVPQIRDLWNAANALLEQEPGELESSALETDDED